MLKFPNGAVIGFSTLAAAAQAFTAISNADPALATVGAAALTDGDIVVVKTSGWPSLANRVAEVGTEAAGVFPLIGIDATDTSIYPAGEGAGALFVASTFVNFSQQGDLSSSGGDQQFWTGQFLEDRAGRQIQVPTFKNAKSFTLPLFYDPSLPWYDAAKKVDAKKEAVVLRVALPDGDTLYYYGYLSFDGDPSLGVNTPMGNTMTFSALGEPSLVEAA